jgi:2-hydroxy-3-keto-5-methylthiopentenyl-1-phosphate phosphatase
MSTPKIPVIFCDFDGTITNSDNIVAIMRHFKPEGVEPIMKSTVEQKLSIREGVGQMFALLPSAMQQEITEFVIGQAGIRDGFQEFLGYVREQQIEFNVTSGGIDFFLKPLLAPFDIDPDHIFCNASDFEGDRIQIVWSHPCDEHCQNDCGMCKTTVMRRYPADRYERILIGDSLTDFEGAKIADRVYSRSHLTVKCQELGVSSTPYETFYDILEDMKSRAGKDND